MNLIVMHSQNGSKSVIYNPSKNQTIWIRFIILGLFGTDLPRYFHSFIFYHSLRRLRTFPEMTIYFSKTINTKKITKLSLAKPQTSETKLNTLPKTCYLPSKLNCRLLLAFGLHAQAVKYINATELSENQL